MHVFWWGFKRGSIFHTHRSRISLSSGWIVKFCKQLNWLLWLWMTWNTERTFQTGHHQSGPDLERSQACLSWSGLRVSQGWSPKKIKGDKSTQTRTHTHTHTHTHTPKIRTKQNKKNCFLTFHMSGWCQTLLLDSQKSLLFLCKREVLSRRECFRTLIYLEMTQLFSTLSSLSLAQDRNSGNQNTWRNDCMFSSVQWLSRVWLFATLWTVAYQASPSMGFSRQEY